MPRGPASPRRVTPRNRFRHRIAHENGLTKQILLSWRGARGRGFNARRRVTTVPSPPRWPRLCRVLLSLAGQQQRQRPPRCQIQRHSRYSLHQLVIVAIGSKAGVVVVFDGTSKLAIDTFREKDSLFQVPHTAKYCMMY